MKFIKNIRKSLRNSIFKNIMSTFYSSCNSLVNIFGYKKEVSSLRLILAEIEAKDEEERHKTFW